MLPELGKTGGRMISAQNSREGASGGPLTHRAYTAFFVGLAMAGKPSVCHVQFKRKGDTLCGTIAEMVESFGPDGREWFKVDSGLGRVWVEARNVRLCSGDGRCACEAGA